MDTDAEAFVSGECPTPSRQARCGQRHNAWERRGSMSDTEPPGEVRASPQCVGTTRQHVRHRAARRGANNAAMRGNALHSPLTYMNDFQEEE